MCVDIELFMYIVSVLGNRHKVNILNKIRDKK